ncbi:hypothetical protein C3432_19580 [Citrobacter amalonaticus]|uniref:DUF930 domain-containing protein n=1 Tax=Citrobacter amalonaticus TaxID=35703 RepID=A0A2S4RXL8_CITAM|nr:hypothetical protein [Citrobacter amalonaticus]POT56179.1 hypothetical protein C3432_19580 [Citrobacter amalonaticus]POT74488.1 hypothetical protein C3436_17220 [Citrobacter amalonaticus]POU65287.1 hypothetical protein C3430_13960 [Citrobacter amalonaticus]POV04122.1 hypothetical protein C3424_18900 [Citrobacter amalonaticus]
MMIQAAVSLTGAGRVLPGVLLLCSANFLMAEPVTSLENQCLPAALETIRRTEPQTDGIFLGSNRIEGDEVTRYSPEILIGEGQYHTGHWHTFGFRCEISSDTGLVIHFSYLPDDSFLQKKLIAPRRMKQ